MFKVGDRILVKSSPHVNRIGRYGTVVELRHSGKQVKAKMDNNSAFRYTLYPGHYTISVKNAERCWVIAGPRKSNRGFAKFVRKIEEVI